MNHSLALLGSLLWIASMAHAGCPITKPEGGTYRNESLEAILPAGGKFIFKPGGSGFVDHDGALGIKVGWERLAHGQLSVGGRRLDGQAAPARAYIPDGYGDIGFQPIYLVFPAPGCWEITGRLGAMTLTFIVLVEKEGDGPAWQFQGVPAGSRVTT